MKYVVLSFATPDTKLGAIISKASKVLGRSMILATTPDSDMNMAFYSSASGHKEIYSENAIPDQGFPVYVNPTFGNLRKMAMKDVKGFLKLSSDKKALAYSTLACLYGLSGKEFINPYVVTKFVVTYSDPSSPKHDDQQFCIGIAKGLGFKVIDLAEKRGRTAFGKVLQKLSANEQETTHDRTRRKQLQT
ncbi:hypothetical protein JCM19235_1271 [Vibrio maritimus]|uniref:Uncharacterized protein n=1 Tax=Vibrio maritimus TaxID=990268 RepID=A0A090S5J2_9VIBR|nr:hypothetical protein JCM19235_1271 [Vibrio maritimus]